MTAGAPEQAGSASPTGSLRELAALGAAALVTRAELAALELSEARERAARWMLLALVAALLLLAALFTASLLVIAVFWDTHRVEAILAVALVQAVAGGALIVWLMARLRSSPPLFDATVTEMKQDCDALRSALRSPT